MFPGQWSNTWWSIKVRGAGYSLLVEVNVGEIWIKNLIHLQKTLHNSEFYAKYLWEFCIQSKVSCNWLFHLLPSSGGGVGRCVGVQLYTPLLPFFLNQLGLASWLIGVEWWVAGLGWVGLNIGLLDRLFFQWSTKNELGILNRAMVIFH